MNASDQIKAESSTIIKKYADRSNTKAAIQCLNTLIPYFGLFYLAMNSLATSLWLAAIYILLLSLFIVRIFMLMHDSGHLSLFKTKRLNAISGFFTGVFVGMPQYVWSQHHNYHHATNGNWEKYRGPLNVLSVNEYERLSPRKQKTYRFSRSMLMVPVGAFMYFIFNPRFNWMLGSLKYLFGVLGKKLKNIRTPLKTIVAGQESRLWKSGREYWHMTMNNIVLLGIWAAASWYFGATTFFTVYIISLSLAGAAGIIIFTIQHNFEGSYASEDKDWDYHLAALKGTSFLTFPKIINWFGADIAYHHIHHMSARIPNYNLARCHREYAYLFDDVTRIRLGDVAEAFKQILWDSKGQRIISVAQYDRMKATPKQV
jgi:omega-6 fatty acid desaturase (delta-12 desaturase)